MTTMQTRWPMICPSDEVRADTFQHRGESRANQHRGESRATQHRDKSRASINLRKGLAYLALDAAMVIAVGGATLAMLL